MFDSGSTKHCASKANLLLGKRDKVGGCLTPSGSTVSYAIAGNVLIQSEYCGRSYFLEEVVHFPNAVNIISVRNFLEQHSCLAQCFCDGFLLRDSRYIRMVSPDYILAKGSISAGEYKFIAKFPGEKEMDSGWYIDSGSSCHSTCNESLLLNGTIEDCEPTIMSNVDGHLARSCKKGSCELTYTSENGLTKRFVLKDVYVFPQRVSLLSVSCFTRDNECSILFAADEYYILDAKDDMILKPELIGGYGVEHRGMYHLR